MSDLIKISLGAGTLIEDGWTHVDIVQLPGIDVVHNLAIFPWPFEDNCAKEIKAIDVLEHMPTHTANAESTYIKFIEEAHRILKPGGILYIQTPGSKATFMWEDPTHVRPFEITSMDFFDPTTHYGKTTGFYSPVKFKVRAEELANYNLRFWMEKI